MSSSAIRYSPCYTVDDHATWEGDWELWNGVTVCVSPLASVMMTSTSARLGSPTSCVPLPLVSRYRCPLTVPDR